MCFRHSIVFGVFSFCLLLFFQPLTGHALEKLTDPELRNVTGQSGFVNSKEDLKKLKSAKNAFESLIRSQGLGSLLSKSTRNKLLSENDLDPNNQAKLLQETTRQLLKNPEFLKQVEEAAQALAQLGQTLRQLNALQ